MPETEDLEEDVILDEYRPQVTDRSLGKLYIVAGLVAFVAAFTLILERIHLLMDPSYKPSCSINPIISCGNVMVTPQASLLGFPNPLIGVAGFPIVILLGIVLLCGFQMPRWMRISTQVGLTLAVALIHFFVISSIYVIGALCPYCMVVWLCVIPLFWQTTVSNLARWKPHSNLVSWLVDLRWLVPVVWVLVVATLIGIRFWYFWSTLL